MNLFFQRIFGLSFSYHINILGTHNNFNILHILNIRASNKSQKLFIPFDLEEKQINLLDVTHNHKSMEYFHKSREK